MRILLVEDHASTLSALGRLLRLRGHEVWFARTLRAGSELCETTHFDLIICDLELPDGDGTSLGGIARRRGAVIVAITGYGLSEHRQRTDAAGFAAHLVKPLAIEELDAMLNAVEKIRARRANEDEREH